MWPFKKLPTIVESKRFSESEILFRLSDGPWVRCRRVWRTASSDIWHAFWEESGEAFEVSSRLGKQIEARLRKDGWEQEALAREQTS